MKQNLWGNIIHYSGCQNWGRASNNDFKCLSAVEFSIAGKAGIRIIAVKLEEIAIASEVRHGLGMGVRVSVVSCRL